MGDNVSLSDKSLWNRIINKNDREALSTLFRKYYKKLLNYGLHLKPCKQLVQDSIQELFYKIWNKRDKLENIEYKVRTYLYSSMSRVLFRQIEIQQNRNERDITYAEEEQREKVTNIEKRIISKEKTEEDKKNLREALETLSDRQKEAAYLKFHCGLSNEEISKVMDVNKQSVYNYIYRAMGALRDEMNVSLTA